ncbi:MAG: hypothetical protein V4667_06005 [Bacteroidota bacterium]
MRTTKKTIAFIRFTSIIHRTDKLIEACHKGIEHDLKIQEGIINKLNIKGLPGKKPKNHETVFKVSKRHPDGTFSLSMDERSAFLVKKTMTDSKKLTEELNNHFYSIMLAYTWASFETFLIMLFEELYTKKPEMLKINTLVTYKEVLENEKQILNYLIQKELETIGHFSVEKYIEYLDKKINLILPEKNKVRLRQLYALRNIIAHNTGIVNNRTRKEISLDVRIKNNEVLISKTYLLKESAFIKTIVQTIERHIHKKFKNSL